jgi:hypothetical protein
MYQLRRQDACGLEIGSPACMHPDRTGTRIGPDEAGTNATVQRAIRHADGRQVKHSAQVQGQAGVTRMVEPRSIDQEHIRTSAE